MFGYILLCKMNEQLLNEGHEDRLFVLIDPAVFQI